MTTLLQFARDMSRPSQLFAWEYSLPHVAAERRALVLAFREVGLTWQQAAELTGYRSAKAAAQDGARAAARREAKRRRGRGAYQPRPRVACRGGCGRMIQPRTTDQTCYSCRRAPKASRELQPCGTFAAYKRHLKAGEPPCEPCREACRQHSRRSACASCAQPVSRSRSSRAEIICQDCRRKAATALTPKRALQSVTCWCGRTFMQTRAGQKYCIDCRQNGRRPSRNGPGHVAADRRRRAVRGATWDGVLDRDILDRDRWRCWICRKAISKKYRFPHPRSASIDHEIPLSLGGDDSELNKRAAHLACNVARNNRVEQMPLFGMAEHAERDAACENCGTWPAPRRSDGSGRRCDACWQPVPGRWNRAAARLRSDERRRRLDELGQHAREMRAAGMKWQDIADSLGLSGTGHAYALAVYRPRQ